MSLELREEVVQAIQNEQEGFKRRSDDECRSSYTNRKFFGQGHFFLVCSRDLQVRGTAGASRLVRFLPADQLPVPVPVWCATPKDTLLTLQAVLLLGTRKDTPT